MKKTNLWKRLVLINGLVVVSVVAVFAWFITSDTASVSGFESSISEASYIKVSQDGGETWENGIDGVNLYNMRVISEVSGNGSVFYEPLYGEGDVIDGFSTVDLDDGKYIEKKFTFEADTTQHIYLTNESTVIPSDPNGNKNDAGISRDYIAGAVRIAFFEVTDEGEDLKYIWVPEPTIEYRDGAVYPNGKVEAAYYRQLGTDLNQTDFVSTGGASSGFSGDFLWGDPETDGVVPLLTLETEGKKPVRGEIIVRIWLEGTDRECVKGLHNGNFKVNLKFDKTVGKE